MCVEDRSIIPLNSIRVRPSHTILHNVVRPSHTAPLSIVRSIDQDGYVIIIPSNKARIFNDDIIKKYEDER